MTRTQWHRHAPDFVALLALLVALPGLWVDPRLFFASWLTAWWFCVGVVMGGLVSAWIHALTGGLWGVALRRAALPLARRLPWLLLLFVPMIGGLQRVFPWAGEPVSVWARDIDRVAFPRAWYSIEFFWIRLVVIALVWTWLAQPSVFARKGRVAFAIVAYVVTGTLAAVDLVESLTPGWYSDAHGLVNLGGSALGGAALATWMLALRIPHAFPRPPLVPARPRPPPVWRDLGNLLLMWVMSWAYLQFMEFLVMWSENLPREVRWIVPRLSDGWLRVSIALAAVQFGACFVALLFRSLKDDPRRLVVVSGVLLAGQLLNCAWLILPSVEPRAALGWWLVPTLALALGLPVAARAWHEIDDAPEVPSPRAPEPRKAIHA